MHLNSYLPLLRHFNLLPSDFRTCNNSYDHTNVAHVLINGGADPDTKDKITKTY